MLVTLFHYALSYMRRYFDVVVMTMMTIGMRTTTEIRLYAMTLYWDALIPIEYYS